MKIRPLLSKGRNLMAETETITKTEAPTKPDRRLDPERYYNPERLCPSQRGDAERWSRP